MPLLPISYQSHFRHIQVSARGTMDTTEDVTDISTSMDMTECATTPTWETTKSATAAAAVVNKAAYKQSSLYLS